MASTLFLVSSRILSSSSFVNFLAWNCWESRLSFDFTLLSLDFVPVRFTFFFVLALGVFDFFSVIVVIWSSGAGA